MRINIAFHKTVAQIHYTNSLHKDYIYFGKFKSISNKYFARTSKSLFKITRGDLIPMKFQYPRSSKGCLREKKIKFSIKRTNRYQTRNAMESPFGGESDVSRRGEMFYEIFIFYVTNVEYYVRD